MMIMIDDTDDDHHHDHDTDDTDDGITLYNTGWATEGEPGEAASTASADPRGSRG